MKLPRTGRHAISIFAFMVTLVVTVTLPLFASQQSLVASSSNVRFGKVAIGSSESQVVDVTNLGSASVTVSAVSVSGSEFSVSGVSLPVSIGAGQTFPLSIKFAPAISGWINEQITLTDSSSKPVLLLTIAGNGVTSQAVTASPYALSFGSVKLGSTATLAIVLTNTRSWKQTINAFQTTGAGFQVSGPALPLVLAPGQSVTVRVSFAPQSSGLIGGSVFVSGPNTNVPVAGTGVSTLSGQLIVAPGSLNFGNVNVGSSTAQPSSLSATGGSVTISAANNNNSQFQISGISLPITIPAGQTLAFDVVFSPTQSGSTSGLISFASNASNGQGSQAMSGAGVAVLKSVDLSWSDSSSSIAGYNVYRGATAGAYARLNTSLEPLTTYTDSTVVSGQTYYYAATAVNSTGQESGYSAAIKVAIP